MRVKKRHTFIFIGIPLVLLCGFIWYVRLIYVAFEHRENHNGVGYNAFSKSIKNHVKSGPNSLNDLSMYEGTWWFTVTDEMSSSYKVRIGRESFSDPRNMNSLKSQYLSVESINGQALECVNNFDEAVSVGISSLESPYMDEGLISLNVMIDRHTRPLSAFGEQLPISYEINEGQVLNAPEWLDFNVKRCCTGGFHNKTAVELEPPTSLICQLK